MPCLNWPTNNWEKKYLSKSLDFSRRSNVNAGVVHIFSISWKVWSINMLNMHIPMLWPLNEIEVPIEITNGTTIHPTYILKRLTTIAQSKVTNKPFAMNFPTSAPNLTKCSSIFLTMLLFWEFTALHKLK